MPLDPRLDKSSPEFDADLYAYYLDNGTINGYTPGAGAAGAGPTAPKATTGASTDIYDKYSNSQLRLLWRAGLIDEAQWKSSLIARGETEGSATALIAADKNTGVSTAAKTKGQLTAGEQADVEAMAKTFAGPPNYLGNGTGGTVDSGPSVGPGAPTSKSGSTGTGSASTSTTKLPLTPEEAFLKKQQDKVEAQQLAARMQRQAEDQYVLDSGGKVQRNAETGALESSTQDSSGKYTATTQHTYDPATGQIAAQAPTGWTNTKFDQGNSLNPEGTWWQNADAATIEDNRRLNAAQLSQKLGRPLTPADLLSPPGGTFALGGGDPAYQKNLSVLAATGKTMPTMTHGPGDPVSGSTGDVINPFGPAGNKPVQLTYGRSTPPPVMTQSELHNYNVTGSINLGAAELGGRTMGELEADQAYGNSPAPAGAKEAVMANIDAGRIFDLGDLLKQYGAKQQAMGAVDVAGMEDPNKVTLPQMANGDENWQGRMTQDLLGGGSEGNGVRGGVANHFWQQDDRGDAAWQRPNWTVAGNSASNSQNFSANLGPTSPTRWDDVAKRWVRNPNYDEQQSFSRGINKFPIYGGSHPSTYLNPFGGTYFANGGTASAGAAGALFPGWGLIALQQQMNPNSPLMHGNIYSNWLARLYGGGPNGYNPGTSNPTNTPTSWAPTPHAEGGTDISTNGPTGLVDMQTGQMKGVYGEDGPEAAVMVPLSRQAKPGLPSMVQSMMMGGNGANTATMQSGGGAPTGTPSTPAPSPVDLIRQQAKLMRPPVKVSIGG